jgi:predicted dehydrogenase
MPFKGGKTKTMSKAPVGVAVIGTGMMGRAFAQICHQLPEARLLGVSDIVESAGRAAAEEFNVPYYKDFADLVSQPEVQAVIVATPEDVHVAPSVAALERGKGVMVEKPIADTAADARQIIGAAEKSGAVLMVGHILRFTTHYAMAKQMVDEGKVGDVQSMQIRILNGKSAQDRLKGRCSLPMFLGVHQYDLVRWIAGSEPARIYAESQFNVLRPLGYEVEDTTWALITFANGVLGRVDAPGYGAHHRPGHLLPGHFLHAQGLRRNSRRFHRRSASLCHVCPRGKGADDHRSGWPDRGTDGRGRRGVSTNA